MQKQTTKTTIRENLEITDFYSAAYLMTLNHELRGVKRTDGISIFIFDDSKDIRSDLARYYTLEGTVIGYDFTQNIKKLKTLIHNEQTIPFHNSRGGDN